MHWLPKTPDSPQPEGYHEPVQHGRTWDRGGGNHYNRSYMHKTKSVDYGIMISGERQMELDDATLTLKPGDIVIDVGAWHLWDSSRTGCMMAFDMFDAVYVDGPAGTAQGNDTPMRPPENQMLPPRVKPQRRVVAIDRDPGAELAEVLREVVSERVVVVDQQDVHRAVRSAVRAIATARSTAPALLTVSWSSVSGTESATRPPPAWT